MMRRNGKTLAWLGFMIGLGLALSSCRGLAADITPPPDQSQPAVPTSAPPTAAVPTAQTREESSPLPTVELDAGSVAVEIQDQTGGSLLEKGLEVTLEGYDQYDLAYQDQLTVPAAGRVVFEDVPFQPGRVFFASIPYGGAIYRSEFVQAGEETVSLNLQVGLYETTTDRAGLAIDRLHLLIDFPQPGLIHVAEIFILSNLGPNTIVAPEPGKASVEFSLPEGAAAVQFEDGAVGQRFLLTETGFGDTVSIPPGSGVYQVLVSYTLPFQRDRLNFKQAIDYPLNAVVIMVPAGQATIKGDSLEDMGTQSLPSQTVQIYSGSSMAPGDELVFKISGTSADARSGWSFPSDLAGTVALIAGILGTLLLGGGIWLYIRNRGRLPEAREEHEVSPSQGEILDSIIALEDLYQAGEISRKDYERKRSELKEQLAEAVRMRDEG